MCFSTFLLPRWRKSNSKYSCRGQLRCKKQFVTGRVWEIFHCLPEILRKNCFHIFSHGSRQFWPATSQGHFFPMPRRPLGRELLDQNVIFVESMTRNITACSLVVRLQKSGRIMQRSFPRSPVISHGGRICWQHVNQRMLPFLAWFVLLGPYPPWLHLPWPPQNCTFLRTDLRVMGHAQKLVLRIGQLCTAMDSQTLPR